MKTYIVKVPPTKEQGSYVTNVSTEWDARYRQLALENYNSARSHDGLPPIKRMPNGTKYTEITRCNLCGNVHGDGTYGNCGN